MAKISLPAAFAIMVGWAGSFGSRWVRVNTEILLVAVVCGCSPSGGKVTQQIWTNQIRRMLTRLEL